MHSEIKILCTLGPSSLNHNVIRRLSKENVDLFRINLSHTGLEELEENINLIKSSSDVPICLDSQGAQIRTGNFKEQNMLLEAGAIFSLISNSHVDVDGGIPIYPEESFLYFQIGDLISVDFNSALLQVIEIKRNIKVRVINGGLIGSNKAITIIDNPPLLPCLTMLDKVAFKLCKKYNIKNVALSFANREEDINELRNIVGKEVKIIAKIESRAGLQNLSKIIDAADAILIDRGDLSREIAMESIPYIQKEIINRANKRNVEVYVATNLLESMIKNSTPTRAEVNDVINTLIDGANGLVLAAETAIGKHPIACVSMINRLIHRYENRFNIHSELDFKFNNNIIFQPHSDKLVQNIISDEKMADISELPKLEIDERSMIDARQIALGVYSPISGFMSKDEIKTVISNYKLKTDDPWTLPIFLQVQNDINSKYAKGDNVCLTFNGEIQSIIEIEEIFQFDLHQLAKGIYNTSSTNHPGVKRLLNGSDTFIAGKVSLLKQIYNRRRPYELTPSQTRLIFQNQHWKRIIGFHTRNVPHRVHEYIQKSTFKRYDCDGLLIHPVIGPKKSGDFNGDIILKSYQELISMYYPPNKVLLGGFNSYSRYAGPKEAVFTALCRKNFGCSHFIIGRDHTGVGSFYDHNESKHLFDKIGDIGIEPIFINEIYYCKKCKKYVEKCKHGLTSREQISGTEFRAKLIKGEKIPDWFMRDSIYKLIKEELKNKTPIFHE